MPKIIQGAVIVKSNGLQITYKEKCEKCGNIENGSNTITAPSSKSTTKKHSFKCKKCSNQQVVEISGGID